MKKQFAIKAINNQKSIILSAAKKESSDLLKFMDAEIKCCDPWNVFKGQAPKVTFSL